MSRYATNRWLLAAILLFAALWLGIWLYSSLPGLPSGMRLSERGIGGLSKEQFREELSTLIENLQKQVVAFDKPGDRFPEAHYTYAQLGLVTNADELLRRTELLFSGTRLDKIKRRWSMRNDQLELEIRFSDSMLRKSLEQRWPELMNPVIRQAERIITEDDRVEYRKESEAMTIDTAAMTEQLKVFAYASFAAMAANPAGTVRPEAIRAQVPLRTVAPEVTIEQLKAQGIARKIASYSTALIDSSPGRTHNIRVTADTIHDRLLKPGERFDYSEAVRSAEQKHGYQEAPVILNGKLVPGIGGGICQVSSTLYNAVLRAGLKVDERRNHSLPVSYVPLGQDATFASGHINFSFTNDSAHYLLIRTETTGGELTIKLFGQVPEHVTFDIESKLIDTLQPPAKYVHNPTLPLGHQTVLQQGTPGYIVETYRIRKENGVAVKTERISRDTYNPQPTLIASNNGASKPDEKDGPPNGGKQIVEDGVSGPVFPRGR